MQLDFVLHDKKLYALTEKKEGVKSVLPGFLSRKTRISAAVPPIKEGKQPAVKLKGILSSHGYDSELFNAARIKGIRLGNGEEHEFEEVNEKRLEALMDAIAEHGLKSLKPVEMTPSESKSFWERHGAKRG